MRLTVSVCAVALMVSASGAVALTAAERCEVGKLIVSGKYNLCRLKAEAKGVKNQTVPDFSKCDGKYALKWAVYEGGDCPSIDDETAIQSFITQHTDDVAAALAGGTLPDCSGDLATCNENLESCTLSNAECNDLFTVCSDDRDDLQELLIDCDADLVSCQSDLAAAGDCGNGTIQPGEDCDFATLNGQTCVTPGFAGGHLACAGGCTFDTNGCLDVLFIDNSDDTITDVTTGLTWEKKCRGCGNLHDVGNRYTWEDGPQSMTIWVQGLNTQFAGHADWRIPSKDELLTIVDREVPTCGTGGTCIAPIFGATLLPDRVGAGVGWYWSATPLVWMGEEPNAAPHAWAVSFSDGGAGYAGQQDFGHVRAVRP